LLPLFPGVNGKTYTLRSFEKARALVIIFSCNHCLTAQAYEDRIIALANDYRPKGAEVVMIRRRLLHMALSQHLTASSLTVTE